MVCILMNKAFIILFLAIFITSGCVEEQKVTPTNISKVSLPNQNQTEIEENIPAINIASYHIGYFGENSNNKGEHIYNFSETFYVVYNISVKNEGIHPIYFRLKKVQLIINDKIFYPTNLSTHYYGLSSKDGIWSNLEKDIKIENDTILFSNQTLYGSIFFNVNNNDVFSDKSFTLKYDNTPVTSASYKDSLSALTTAELFDYSMAFGMPPYEGSRETDFCPEINYYLIYPNWVNRSVFEYYRKTDPEYTLKYLPLRNNPDDLPRSDIAYAIKVIYNRNLTIFPGNRLFVIDDMGEEIFNKSIADSHENIGLAIRSNQEYLLTKDVPHLNYSNATIIQMKFTTAYGWGLAMRLSINYQDIIVDENQNLVLARYHYQHFIS